MNCLFTMFQMNAFKLHTVGIKLFKPCQTYLYVEYVTTIHLKIHLDIRTLFKKNEHGVQ